MLRLIFGVRTRFACPARGISPIPSARILLLVTACLAAASPTLYGQVSITGTIAGSVTDASQAVLPTATVTLKDEGTGIQKTTATNGSGNFAFRDLNLGSYQVTVSLQRFQTAVYNKVIVEAGRTTDVRVQLAIGALSKTSLEGLRPSSSARPTSFRARSRTRISTSCRLADGTYWIRAARAGRRHATWRDPTSRHAFQRHARGNDQSDS